MHERFVCVLFFWVAECFEPRASTRTARPRPRVRRGACRFISMGVRIFEHVAPRFRRQHPGALALPNSLFRVSSAEGFELEGGPSAQPNRTRLGRDDVVARGTERCADRHQDPALAARRGVARRWPTSVMRWLPTGDSRSLALIGAWSTSCASATMLGRHGHWVTTWAMTWPTAGAAFTYAMAVGKAINDRFGLYFEPYGELVLRKSITPASMRA